MDRLTPRAQEGRDAVRSPETDHAARPAAATRTQWRQDEFHLAAAVQNLRKLAKISIATQMAMT
jgi:hypothetical protein